MIIYDLSCDNEHRFEGWFRSADDFERQLSEGLVQCPQCDSHVVRRIPSAVAIGHKHEESQAAVQKPQGPANLPENMAVMAAGTLVAGLYQQLVQAVIQSSEDVGSDFATEARKIHYNESHARAIHGNATEEEFEALQDEGIAILRLPKLREEDLN